MPAIVELLGGAEAALILLGAAIVWAFASGALAAWGATFGQMFLWMADHLRYETSVFGKHVGFDFGGVFRAANQSIVAALQHVRNGAEIDMALSIRVFQLIWQGTAEAVDALASETEQMFDRLIHGHLPKWAKYAVPVTYIAGLVAKLVRAEVAKLQPKVIKTVRVVEHDVPHTITRYVRQAVGAAQTVPGWVIHLPREIGSLRRANNRLGHRVKRLEGIFGATVAAGIIANVLGVSARCLRRGNVGKAARSVCGLDTNLLDSLLLDGLAIVGALSVVEFAEGLRAIEGEAVKILGAGIREWPS